MSEEAVQKSKLVIEGEHLLGKFEEAVDGPTLVVFGGIHGNEPAGVLAVRRVLAVLEKLRGKLSGRVYFLAGNTRALVRNVRFVDTDLNRFFTLRNISRNLLQVRHGQTLSEDRELKELLEILQNILRTAEDEVFVVDLHSTSAEGLPFLTVGDTLRNRHFAQKFPVTILLGIEEQLDGTVLEYLNNLGTVTLGFEGGQHQSEAAIDNHESLIWLALVEAGCLKAEDAPELESFRQRLARNSVAAKIVEIRHREAIKVGDEFKMNPGYENFQSVKSGEILANNKKGVIKAGETGLILMPLYQAQGEDGFFLGREVSPFWLWLSERLRKANLPAYVHLLPGVKKHETEDGVYVINTNIARFFPLQIFHLLGFRKRREQDKKLIVSRRLYDTRSPFKSDNGKNQANLKF